MNRFHDQVSCRIPGIAFAMVLICGVTACAQTSNKPGKVSARVVLSQDGVHAGTTCYAAVVLRIESGWHINSAKPEDENLVATSVETNPPAGLQVARIEYPPGVERTLAFSDTPLDVYEHSVTIVMKLDVVKGLKSGKYMLPVTVYYQACNDNICLAPAAVAAKAEIRIVPATKKITLMHESLFRDLELKEDK